jgi:hypothetical protein
MEQIMQLTQNQLERLQDLMQRGELTADQANVERVKMMRVHLVTCRLPQQVRTALNAAVKRGELGHVKKDGNKPEAYYHPTFQYLVAGERNEHEQNVLKALASVLAPNHGGLITISDEA